MHYTRPPVNRRGFIARTLRAGAAAGVLGGFHRHARPQGDLTLRAGEAHVDTTPPKEIELAGFHYPVGGNPRYITDIRQKTAARALVLQYNLTQVALLSLDIASVSGAMTKRVQAAVAAKTGIPAENVHLCATHTHSMPTFAYWRQWGTIPEEYMAAVEAKAVEAVIKAQADCAEAMFFVGGSPSDGGNFNRTVKGSKTDRDFTPDATDGERWLDTLVQVLYFERGGDKNGILWYHFAAHPVCYNDGHAGPDWPGLVEQRVRENFDMTPSFLQGHAGDVNPGNGEKWIGEAEQSANAVYAAIDRAMNRLQKIDVDRLAAVSDAFPMPLDLDRHRQWLETYAENPDQCVGGVWVDAGFAKEWYEAMKDRDWAHTLPIPVSALQIGSVALAFHPGELFSFYGLQIRHASPFAHTLLAGYTDGSVGYITDPAAYNEGDGGIYAAVTVPKILDLPPFTPTAGRELATGVGKLLGRIAG